MYLYYWKDPYRQQWSMCTHSSLILDYNMINTTLHDGEWQCKISNVMGNSTAGKISIVVNGKYLYI